MRAFALIALLLASPVRLASGTDDAREAFAYVCDALVVDCSELEPPEVRFAQLVELRGWLGYFWPLNAKAARIVWLDLSLEGDVRLGRVVTVHETTHYVDHHLGITQGGPCEREELAFRVSNLFALERGLGDLVRWDWRRSYPECQASSKLVAASR